MLFRSDNNDRRYFVLFSRWQSRDALAAFKRENPDYYMELHNAIRESAGAIRKFFLEYEIDPEFNPMGDAPHTAAHDHMVEAAMPEEVKQIIEVIESKKYSDISYELVNVTRLTNPMSVGLDIPAKALSWALKRGGWFGFKDRVKEIGRAHV